ncbi:hypothetical protein C8J57DRAFT_1247773 [Mycena rebaudengoi]|nr:hypothetical protein C8J57DRAFT_1247773 [Mycena rebaudengoi]
MSKSGWELPLLPKVGAAIRCRQNRKIWLGAPSADAMKWEHPPQTGVSGVLFAKKAIFCTSCGPCFRGMCGTCMVLLRTLLAWCMAGWVTADTHQARLKDPFATDCAHRIQLVESLAITDCATVFTDLLDSWYALKFSLEASDLKVETSDPSKPLASGFQASMRVDSPDEVSGQQGTGDRFYWIFCPKHRCKRSGNAAELRGIGRQRHVVRVDAMSESGPARPGSKQRAQRPEGARARAMEEEVG